MALTYKKERERMRNAHFGFGFVIHFCGGRHLDNLYIWLLILLTKYKMPNQVLSIEPQNELKFKGKFLLFCFSISATAAL